MPEEAAPDAYWWAHPCDPYYMDLHGRWADEDGDGVLDGLDRCSRTPTGTPVTPNGCPQGQAPNRPPPSAAPVPPPAAQPQVNQPPAPTPQAGRPNAARPNAARPPPKTQPDTLARPMRRPNAAVPSAGAVSSGIIPGVGFAPGTARLLPSSYQALDSIADLLQATPNARIEVGATPTTAARRPITCGSPHCRRRRCGITWW
jgi:hypothetical protein